MFGFERLLDVFAKTANKTKVFDEISKSCTGICSRRHGEQADDHTLIEVRMQDAPSK
jgi:hypothetical protein